MSARIILIDDLDGTPATETLRFTYDGTPYEIDLSTDNAAKFRDDLAPFITAGRRSAATSTPKRTYARRKTAVAAVVEVAEAPRVKRKYVRKTAIAAKR